MYLSCYNNKNTFFLVFTKHQALLYRHSSFNLKTIPWGTQLPSSLKIRQATVQRSWVPYQFAQLYFTDYYATIFYGLLLMDTQRMLNPQHLTQCLAYNRCSLWFMEDQVVTGKSLPGEEDHGYTIASLHILCPLEVEDQRQLFLLGSWSRLDHWNLSQLHRQIAHV